MKAFISYMEFKSYYLEAITRYGFSAEAIFSDG